MPEAARLTDPIAHTSALAGFLVGAIIGIALIAAVAFATFTCGFGVALLAGLAAGLGASGILALGEGIGKMFSSRAGQISSGSLNVFVNNKAAAFATASAVACDNHSPTPLIAEGSGNVFINSLPAARKGDAITCGAKIDDGSQDTFIGGGTVRYLEVDDEVPGWLRTAVDWAFALAGLAGGLAGLLKAAGGLSRAVLPCAAKFIGGFVIGEAVGRTVIGPAISQVYGGLFGHPVDVTTGRKLLLATDEADFTLASPLPLQCGRFYASNVDRVGALGKGWVLPWELRLERREGRLWFTDAQGRETGFPLVQPGHNSFSPEEQKYLACTYDGRYVVRDINEQYFDFGELAPGDGPDTALLQRIEDQTGHWLAFHRTDDSEQVRLIMSSGGQQLRLSYLHPKGRLTEIELVHQRKSQTLVRYAYDAEAQLASVTDANGQISRRFEYEDGLMIAHTNALGFRCAYVWQTLGGQPRVVQTSTSEGEIAHFSYDLPARETRVVDELGREGLWRYDAHFQVVECVDLDGKRYRTEFNATGMPQVLHLPAEEGQARTVRFDYDEANRIVAETDVLGRTTHTRYHRDSLKPEQVTLPDGRRWTFEYDAVGRLLKSTDPLGREERNEYPEGSASPWPVARVDAKGGRKLMQWDRSGHLLSYTDCSGKITRYDYDPQGRVVGVTNALDQTTRVERLPGGQTRELVLPDGSEEHFEYDAAGLVVAHRDRAGHERRWQRNPRGQVVLAVDPTERALQYRYDPQGRLIELAAATGAYHFRYDAGDRLLQEVRPDGLIRQWHYGAFGQALALLETGTATPESAALPERVIHYERDDASRLLAQRNDTSTTRYTWDDGDRLLKADKRPTEAGKALGVNASLVAFQYDAAGRLIGEKGRDGLVSYELDELDQLAALDLPNEQRISWLSYGSGHVHQVRCGDHLVADIERDDLHREVLRSQGLLVQGTGYDALGRRTWQSAATDARLVSPAQGKFWRTYRYSAEGELAEQSDNTRGALWFQYDPAGQMIERAPTDSRAELEQFAWDAAGNLLDQLQRSSEGRVEGNRLTMWQDIRFDYDAWGNLKTKRSGARQTQHLVFDAENRLLAVHVESSRGRTDTRFEYDALGRRIGKTERHSELSGVVYHLAERRFVWQGLRMVQELRETGLSNYIYSPDSPYTPMARLDVAMGPGGAASPAPVLISSAQVKAEAAEAIGQAQASARLVPVTAAARRERLYHFHTDLVGTPLEMTDEQGELAWAGDYTAWGKLRLDTDHAFDARTEQPLRYPGQYADESTGLHYNTFRYYDPDIGRFISQDPIGLLGGENLYEYAPNPVSWQDPLGLTSDRFPSWMSTTQGYQRQHLIPYSLREHPFFVRSGMSINGASNMMRLPVAAGIDPNPNLGLHRGWTAEHAAYNRGVAAELDALEQLATKNNWDYRRAQQEVLALQHERRAGFKSGLYTCA